MLETLANRLAGIAPCLRKILRSTLLYVPHYFTFRIVGAFRIVEHQQSIKRVTGDANINVVGLRRPQVNESPDARWSGRTTPSGYGAGS